MEQSIAMDLEMEAGVWRADAVPFEDIVDQHGSMVFSIALHHLRDRALAEDVAQEAFFRLSRNLHAIASETHLALWLRRVTARLCIDEFRRPSRSAPPLEAVPEPAVDPHSGDFLLDERLRDLVASLPAPARMAVVLRFQEDLDPAEIADVLQEPVNTVKSRLQRALATLRRRLGQGAGP